MDNVVFAGRTTSRIGLGCGRLVGGASGASSRKIVEQALALGITHFDVAPSYGLGTAEDVLGDVLSGVSNVTVTTKVGIGRPSNPGLRALARQTLRPLLSLTPRLKANISRAGQAGQERGLFAPEQMRASLEESLRRLRRERVDAVLLHQPELSALTDATVSTLEAMILEGRAGAVGSSTGGKRAALTAAGTVAQYRWSPGEGDQPTSGDRVLHGVLRGRSMPSAASELLRSLGRDPTDPAAWPGALLTHALATSTGAIILVSSTSPERLADAVGAVDWGSVRVLDGDTANAFQALLAD